jgi:hypothetical protein
LPLTAEVRFTITCVFFGTSSFSFVKTVRETAQHARGWGEGGGVEGG